MDWSGCGLKSVLVCGGGVLSPLFFLGQWVIQSRDHFRCAAHRMLEGPLDRKLQLAAIYEVVTCCLYDDVSIAAAAAAESHFCRLHTKQDIV